MKKFTKSLAILLSLIMCFGILPLAASAAAPIASGDFGEYGSGTWAISADEVLTISGEVGMSGEFDGVPWRGYDAGIKSVTFVPGSHAKAGASLACMFYEFESVTSIDLSNFDTSSATDMSYMFAVCTSLTSLDLSSLDTSSVTDMSYMFAYCFSLTSLDLSSFDTSSVENMQGMFYAGLDPDYSSALTAINLSSFDTSSVTDMSNMFLGCSSLTSLDVSSFDTSSVEDMEGMFYLCSSLATLDLTNFDTSSVTDMSAMFIGCSSLTTLDLTNFDTSSVLDMQYMFLSCTSLTFLDLSSFDTTFVRTMEGMFDDWDEATPVQPVVGWARTAADSERFNDAAETGIDSTKLVFQVKSLESIAVTTKPVKLVYYEGEDFDSTGMAVQASYINGATKEITNYTVTDGENLALDKDSVTISYTEGGVTKTATVSILVKNLASITVTAQPTKTAYIAGENFDPAGMVVTANYTDNSSAVITNYTVTNGSIAAGQSSVTISYTENGVTKTADVAIGVFTGIEIASNPSTTAYNYKSAVSKDGLKVMAVYSNGEKHDVTSQSTVKDFDSATTGDKRATVEYLGKTASFNYSVKYAWWQMIIRILLLGFLWY